MDPGDGGVTGDGCASLTCKTGTVSRPAFSLSSRISDLMRQSVNALTGSLGHHQRAERDGTGQRQHLIKAKQSWRRPWADLSRSFGLWGGFPSPNPEVWSP